jgi:hypothetical protein
VGQLSALLRANGQPITDTNGLTTPRIRLAAAMSNGDRLFQGSSTTNDRFANARPLDAWGGTTVDSTQYAADEPGEPDHAGNVGGASVWFKYVPPIPGTLTLATRGSTFDTILGVYTGAAVNALTTVGGDDDSGPNYSSRLQVAVQPNTTYWIAVDAYNGYLNASRGAVTLTHSLNQPSNDDKAPGRILLGPSGSETFDARGATSEPLEDTDRGAGRTLWFRWQAPMPGTATFSTAGSGYNTVLTAWRRDGSADTELGTNDDASGLGSASALAFSVQKDQTFTFRVDNAPGAAGGQLRFNWGIGTPSFSVNDVTITEGMASKATFTATLSGPTPNQAQVQWSTSPGSASAGGDFTSASGTLSFPPGVVSVSFDVATPDDSKDEADEQFSVNLVNPSYATILDGQGMATIVDNDPLPRLRIGDATIVEPSFPGSTATMSFPVSLTGSTQRQVTVAYSTSNGTAVAGSDFQSRAATLVFNAGVTSQTALVDVLNDSTVEPDETFSVNLSNPVAASIEDGRGDATILAAKPTVSIDDVTANEGTKLARFTMRLSAPTGNQVDVSYQPDDGTAHCCVDFTYNSARRVVFLPGETSKPVDITLIDDDLDEADETFSVRLTSVSAGATIGDGVGQGKILDNDYVPTVTVGDAQATEGNNMVQPSRLNFTVSLSTPSGLPVTVWYKTADGTAVAPGDYQAASGQLDFAPGQTTKTVSVVVQGELTVEPTETMKLTITAGNAYVVDGEGIGTIYNDDCSTSNCT